MIEIRSARPDDLTLVASWIGSEQECRLWSGARVAYPIDLATLPVALQYVESESHAITSEGRLVAFGQLVRKPGGRLHLARMISAPRHRREGWGRRMAAHLLGAALARGPAAISLNVDPGNGPALALYGSLGFAPAARPADEPESDSVYMERTR